MNVESNVSENGEGKFHLSRLVTSRLQKWSERAISHVKAAKEMETKVSQEDENTKKSPEKILPQTNQIKELESALTELVNVHVNGSPTRQRSVDECDTKNGEVIEEFVLYQNVSSENKGENKATTTKLRTGDNRSEYDREKTLNANNTSTLMASNKSSSDVKGSSSQENSQPGLHHGTLVHGSPHVNKKYQPAKMTGKLGSNETKLSELLPVADNFDHDERHCSNQDHCTSVNKNTRNKQLNTEDNMKSQDDSAASQRKVPKRPVLRKHKSEGDILKQRVQMSLVGLDFNDADISAFAAECLKAADLKQQQRKESQVENTDNSPTNGKTSTSPVSGRKLQKQRQPRKISKGESVDLVRGSSSPPNSQDETPSRRSFECGNPTGRTIHKVSEDEETGDCTAKDFGQRQLHLATKKLEKLIRKTDTIQETAGEDKRHHELRSQYGERKTSTDIVSPLSNLADIGEEMNKENSTKIPKVPAKLAIEELKTEKLEVKTTEPRNRRVSRDETKREEYEKKSSRKNSAQESEITLRSYKTLVRDNIYSVDDNNQDTDSGKKTLERLEMLRQDLNSKPKPKLHKFPSLPLFYTPSGMSQNDIADKSKESDCTETRVDNALSDIKNPEISKDRKMAEINKLFHDDIQITYKEEKTTGSRAIGSSCFYVNETHGPTISLTPETKSGLSTFYTPSIAGTNSTSQ